ncbi:MAG: hypothetical protein ACE5OZ_23530, partial [Candidatus Heimdallarchaeota archaeon]
YKALKDEIYALDPDASLSPGYDVTSRTTASGRGSPVDHILKAIPIEWEGQPVHMFVNDKSWNWSQSKLADGSTAYYFQPPNSKLVKGDLLNQIYWSEGDGGKMKYLHNGEWKPYEKGLESVDASEVEIFKTVMKEFQGGSPGPRIMVSRQMGLAKDETGVFVFGMSLQIGVNDQSTLRNAIEVMKKAGGKFEEEADEMIRTIAYLSERGYVHHNLILDNAFFIKNSTGAKLGTDTSEKVILRNFKEGLRKQGINIPKEIPE